MAIKPVLLDVNAYTAFKKGDADAVQMIKHIPKIILNPIIIGELLSGFVLGTKEKNNRKELDLFLSSTRVDIVDIDSKTSEFYSIVFKELKTKGKPIPTNDLWIIATAKQYDAIIFTLDSHFNYVAGLRIISKYADWIHLLRENE